MLAICLDKTLNERLAAVARRTGQSKTMIAREAIAAKIGDLEDLAAAEAALNTAFSEGGEQLEKLRICLGLVAPPTANAQNCG